MKTMTCKQLGGACDLQFQASSFEEIGAMSKEHAMEMFQKGDKDHLEAADKMKGLMQNPEDMKNWMQSKRKEFEEKGTPYWRERKYGTSGSGQSMECLGRPRVSNGGKMKAYPCFCAFSATK